MSSHPIVDGLILGILFAFAVIAWILVIARIEL